MNRSSSDEGRPQSSRDTHLERELIAASFLFDADWYIARAGRESSVDPIGHYLQEGWQAGLEPNAAFPGTLLLPYFASIGINEPPAITWLVLQSARCGLPATWAEIEWLANEVRKTGLFDEEFYAHRLSFAASSLDPAIHYVVVGDRMGLPPSAEFDPAYYGQRNPDVVQAGFNCLLHYAKYGLKERRRGSPSRSGRLGLKIEDKNKANVILVIHETSRTGAPILGWNIASHLSRRYNLYTLHLGPGDLTAAFEALSVEVYGPFPGFSRYEIDADDLDFSLRRLMAAHHFEYAIVNSSESRLAVAPLVRGYIPTLLLLHEFASYVNPIATLYDAFDWSTDIIFPARIVARAAEDVYPRLRQRRAHIMPQGMSVLPPNDPPKAIKPATGERSVSILGKLTQKHDLNGTFLVLGAGFVHIRKGVDLFLAAAATIVRSQPGRDIHFLWVGDGFTPKNDVSYSVYLSEQINRSGLQSHVTFLEPVADLDPIYDIADLFFLSSRLDPFPNVSIDAAVRGIPIVCFKDASGTAELLLSDPTTAGGVVDHLDAEAAGRLILALAGDEKRRSTMAAATLELSRTRFNMERYVDRLDALGTSSSQQMKKRLADAETLVADGTFDQDMFLGLSHIIEPRGASIARYLALARAGDWTSPHVPEGAFRRPCAGFNPFVYSSLNAHRLPHGVDPLADFVRQGKPPGPWFLPILRPDDATAVPPSRLLRVALHAHFYYPELAGSLLTHLQSNTTPCDLFVSTDGEEKAEKLRCVFAKYSGGNVEIRAVPNKGRDIGPLLIAFADQISQYDVIGHVHGKRSVAIGDDALGERWRSFLWQNLLGGLHPMADRIVAAFERDKSLGLVFPSDPHMNAWDENRPLGGNLAARMGWIGELPGHFDFPLGTMFWARREALEPLLRLGLTLDDFPEEPLPYDGTILHALERLPPFACQLAGFKSAVTHIAGVSW
jgi:glycosyltransferase involved in cell wall biosynthesis